MGEPHHASHAPHLHHLAILLWERSATRHATRMRMPMSTQRGPKKQSTLNKRIGQRSHRPRLSCRARASGRQWRWLSLSCSLLLLWVPLRTSQSSQGAYSRMALLTLLGTPRLFGLERQQVQHPFWAVVESLLGSAWPRVFTQPRLMARLHEQT